LMPGNVEAMMALSGEMRHRIDTADADIRNAVNRHTAGKMKSTFSGKLAHFHDGAIAHAYIFIRYLQTYLVDIPLWHAANQGALQKGLSEEAAIAAADDAVITAQGGGSAKDTALIEGNIPVVEWLTMFYSYGSAYLNQQITLGLDIGDAVAHACIYLRLVSSHSSDRAGPGQGQGSGVRAGAAHGGDAPVVGARVATPCSAGYSR